jgi:PPOX class probable F420-dependent enzyme
MELIEFGNKTFIALETFRKNGTGVSTPVWVTQDNGKLYVWTNLNSWKIKRIRNNGKVRLCESDARGTPKSEWVEAQAQVLNSETARKKARTLFKKKYGVQFWMFSLMGRKEPKAVIEIS